MRALSLLPVLLLAAGLPGLPAVAAGDTTLVSKVFGNASAAPKSVLQAGSAFATGARSKSELISARGVVRLGERAELDTLSHGIALRRGVTLVASEPGRFRKTIEVRAPGYRLQVQGTVQVAFDPGRSMKIVALEGRVTVALDSVMGEFESLNPGQMLVINPSDHRLPEPVDIDIQRLTATSALVGGQFGALATSDKIKAAAGAQTLGYQRGTLADTSLLLRGLDNAVEIERARLSPTPVVRRPLDSAIVEQTLFQAVNDLNNPRAIVFTRPYQFPDNTGKTGNLGDSVLARDPLNESRTNILTVELTQQKLRLPHTPPVVNGSPTISGTVSASPDFFGGSTRILRFIEIDPDAKFARLQIAPTAVVSSPLGVDLEFDVNHGLDVNGGKLLAGTDGKAEPSRRLFLTSEAQGITITNSSDLQGGTIAIEGGTAGGDITIDDHSKLTAKSTLRMGSPSLQTGITIRNSSELLSMAGSLQVVTNRAPISVQSNATLTSARDLLVDAYLKAAKDKQGNPVTSPGIVNLTDATLTGLNVRVRGYSTAGDALVIDGSTLTATQLLKLFAEGLSTLRFQNNVTLSGKQVLLAGKTIVVDPHGMVTITGKARVFTDNAQFNDLVNGTMEANGKKVMTTEKFDKRGKF